MDLEVLARTITELRERAKQYQSLMAQNEAQTRISLIDPLLRALGWPLEGPARVLVEVRIGNSRVDYVLRAGEQPLLVLEAKSLGSTLNIAQSAAVSYAWKLVRQGQQSRWVGVTDGLRWAIYDPHNLKSAIIDIDVGDTKRSAESQALALAQVLWPRLFAGVSSRPVESNAWVPLSKLFPRPGAKPPVAVRFPDNRREVLDGRTWKALLVAVAEWLIEKGKLTASACPIPIGGKTYLVHTEPIYPTGKRFRVPYRLSNGLMLDGHYWAPDAARHSRRLLQRFGVDPTEVLVEIDGSELSAA